MSNNSNHVAPHTARKVEAVTTLMSHLEAKKDVNPTVSLAALQEYYKQA